VLNYGHVYKMAKAYWEQINADLKEEWAAVMTILQLSIAANLLFGESHLQLMSSQ
jgi:hypothetical protein